MIPNIGLFDVLIGGFYLLMSYFFIRLYLKRMSERSTRVYFLVGISLKILGGIGFALLSMFVFKSGDTFLYFEIAESLRANLVEQPGETIQTLFTSYSGLAHADYNPLSDYGFNYDRSSTWNFSRLLMVLNLFTFGSYLATTILFSILSFVGLWLSYSLFLKCINSVKLITFIAIFGIPSALIWSSGILKDTLIVAAILTSVYILFTLKQQSLNWLAKLAGLLVCMCLLYFLRPLYMAVFVACSLIIILPMLTSRLGVHEFRKSIHVLLFTCIVGLGILANYLLLPPNSNYRVDNIMIALKGFQTFHSMDVFAQGDNSYTLGGIVEDPLDAIVQIPASLGTTYFRPFLWEVNNLPMLLGAIESLLLFVLLMVILFRYFNRFKEVIQSTTWWFFMCFSLVMAVIVGMSAYNFGALSRYKISCITFLIIAMSMIIQDKVDNFKTN